MLMYVNVQIYEKSQIAFQNDYSSLHFHSKEAGIPLTHIPSKTEMSNFFNFATQMDTKWYLILVLISTFRCLFIRYVSSSVKLLCLCPDLLGGFSILISGVLFFSFNLFIFGCVGSSLLHTGFL